MKRGKDLLYPQRQRCLKCRRFFAFLVVDRLYDTYECPGKPNPPFELEDLPRSCKHFRGRKMLYLTPEEAEAAAKQLKKESYYCDLHGAWHIGSRSAA